MDFSQSQTRLNLARSFAGESQARNRYTIFANIARRENQEVIARIFETTADNERAHAEEFLEKLQKYGKNDVGNITYEAGYPYKLGTTADNLRAAMEGEWEEYADAYPAFARIAAEEGYADVAQLWNLIASIESVHHQVFKQTYEQLTAGELYQKNQPILWRCANCGYTFSAQSAGQTCPVCGKPTGWMQGDINHKPAAL